MMKKRLVSRKKFTGSSTQERMIRHSNVFETNKRDCNVPASLVDRKPQGLALKDIPDGKYIQI